MKKTPQALILRAPGINCDRETAQACRLVGFHTTSMHINVLLKAPERLLDYDLLVIPGGFSYGDDLGAGTLLAKNLTIHLGKQLQQFIDEGRLVLGICNGFQVLVRAGLLPGKMINIASLTNNASAQFECRWITLHVQASSCIFTQGIEYPIELPVAHGEGQFVLANPTLLDQLQGNGQIPIIYASNGVSVCDLESRWGSQADKSALPAINRGLLSALFSSNPLGAGVEQSGVGTLAPPSLSEGNELNPCTITIPYPDNPNGSIGNIAGLCNEQGNVFGLMPHPERYVHALQHPQRHSSHLQGKGQGEGDGLQIFKNAFEYATKLNTGFSGSAPELLQSREDLICRPRLIAGSADLSASDASVKEGNVTTLRSASTYVSSGVNIAAADTAKELMKEAVCSTQGPQVLAGMGAFAGVFDAAHLQQMKRPALVASMDGVGTKTLLAAQAGRFDSIGYDLVNHSVNDVLTQGAKPLFFMDYLAMGKLDPSQAAAIVQSVAAACQEVGCALLGGETAEMPDVYLPGAFDLAGTIVGVIEQDTFVNGAIIAEGDILLGLPSSGLHTNGYSLARRVFAPYALDTVFPELGEPLIDALLRPHRCYLREIELLMGYPGDAVQGLAASERVPADMATSPNMATTPDIATTPDMATTRDRHYYTRLDRFPKPVYSSGDPLWSPYGPLWSPWTLKGIAHITGGGFEGNITRILPSGMSAVITTAAWKVPPLFQLLRRLGRISPEEMYRTLNMGVGMVLVVSPKFAMRAKELLPELLTVGYITQGQGIVLQIED